MFASYLANMGGTLFRRKFPIGTRRRHFKQHLDLLVGSPVFILILVTVIVIA